MKNLPRPKLKYYKKKPAGGRPGGRNTIAKPGKPPERPLKTLDRVFSKAGLGSRSDARSWIGAGRVRVNGK